MSTASATLASLQEAYDAVLAQLAEGRAVVTYRIRGREVTNTDPAKALTLLGNEIERFQRIASREGRSPFRVASLSRASRRGTT